MFQSRISDNLDKVISRAPQTVSDIVIFAHGGVQMAAAAIAKGQRMNDLMKERNQNKAAFNFNYLSVLSIEYLREEQKWQNDIAINPGPFTVPMP
jgi:broad specificity phosphatase PhoE